MTDRSVLSQDLLAEWYLSYRKPVFALCYSYLKDVHEADEAVQDTFLKALKKRDSYRGDAPPIAWLRRIAVNVCLDRLRSFSWKIFRKRANPQDQDLQLVTPPTESSRVDLQAALDKGLAKLSARQKMVFVLRFYEDLSLEEIAQTMSLSVGSVKRHLYRAMHRLKQIGGQI